MWLSLVIICLGCFFSLCIVGFGNGAGVLPEILRIGLELRIDKQIIERQVSNFVDVVSLI